MPKPSFLSLFEHEMKSDMPTVLGKHFTQVQNEIEAIQLVRKLTEDKVQVSSTTLLKTMFDLSRDKKINLDDYPFAHVEKKEGKKQKLVEKKTSFREKEEVSSSGPPKIKIQATCQQCGQRWAWLTNSYVCFGREMNLCLAGRRCPQCQKFRTASVVVKIDDYLVRKAMVPQEEFVDENLKVIDNPLPENIFLVEKHRAPSLSEMQETVGGDE